jgi:hypothetical protein
MMRLYNQFHEEGVEGGSTLSLSGIPALDESAEFEKQGRETPVIPLLPPLKTHLPLLPLLPQRRHLLIQLQKPFIPFRPQLPSLHRRPYRSPLTFAPTDSVGLRLSRRSPAPNL